MRGCSAAAATLVGIVAMRLIGITHPGVVRRAGGGALVLLSRVGHPPDDRRRRSRAPRPDRRSRRAPPARAAGAPTPSLVEPADRPVVRARERGRDPRRRVAPSRGGKLCDVGRDRRPGGRQAARHRRRERDRTPAPHRPTAVAAPAALISWVQGLWPGSASRSRCSSPSSHSAACPCATPSSGSSWRHCRAPPSARWC